MSDRAPDDEPDDQPDDAPLPWGYAETPEELQNLLALISAPPLWLRPEAWAEGLLRDAAAGRLPAPITWEHVRRIAASPDPRVRALAPLFAAHVRVDGLT